MKCSPGIFRNTGSPAPTPRKTASKCLQEFIHGFGAADDRVDFDLDAHAFQEVTFLGDDGLGQTEFRDAVEQHAAGAVQGLEDGTSVALLDQVAGHGQAGGTGAHHRHLLAGGFGLGGQDVLAVLALVIGGEAPPGCRWPPGRLFCRRCTCLRTGLPGGRPGRTPRAGSFSPRVCGWRLQSRLP